MLTVLAVGSGATVQQNAAIEIAIKSFKDAPAQLAVFIFEPVLPAPLKFIPVVIDNPVQGRLLGAMPSEDKLLFSGSLPCGLHRRRIAGLEKSLRGDGGAVHQWEQHLDDSGTSVAGSVSCAFPPALFVLITTRLAPTLAVTEGGERVHSGGEASISATSDYLHLARWHLIPGP